MCSVNGERLFLKGANLAADPPRPRRRRPPTCGATWSWPSRPDSTPCGCRPTSPTDELYAAADELGVLLLQDFPLQWGYARSIRREAVRQAREAVDAARPPSVDHPVVCPRRAGRRRAATRGDSSAPPVRPHRASAAADVEQVGARPLGQAGVRAGRPDAADDRPQRRAPPSPAARRHRQPPLARVAPRRGRRAGGAGAGAATTGAVRQRVRRPVGTRQRAGLRRHRRGRSSTGTSSPRITGWRSR